MFVLPTFSTVQTHGGLIMCEETSECFMVIDTITRHLSSNYSSLLTEQPLGEGQTVTVTPEID